MTREVHEIPPAPRLVRWRAVLWRRWPLLIVGFLFGVYGGLFAIMLGYMSTGGLVAADTWLDANPTRAERTPAVVTEIEPHEAPLDGQRAERVHFRFSDKDGDPLRGQCITVAGRYRVDEPAVAEYDPAHQSSSRLVGTRVATVPIVVALDLWLRVVVLPGFGALALWAFGVWRARRMLSQGTVAVAEIAHVRQLRLLGPQMLVVRFRFRDHRARVRLGRHWVRAHSPLGQRLVRASARVAVVHDRRHPRRCRLVTPEDFLTPLPSSGAPSSGTPLPNA